METFKTEQKEKKEEPKKKFLYLLDQDQTEIKKLDEEDVIEAVKIMRKCDFDVTENEVTNILKYNASFGCYVNRMLIGVGLAWPAHLDLENKKITGEASNAIYLEDPAVLLAFEGRGIRRILLKTREDFARDSDAIYSIAYLSEDLPTENIEVYIKEGGTQLEKLYLSEGYEFFKTERGILTVKKLAKKKEEEKSNDKKYET